MAKSRRVGWVAINVFPLTSVAVFSLRFSLPKLKDKARREVRDRTDVGSSAPSSFAAEVKVSLYFLWIYLVMV